MVLRPSVRCPIDFSNASRAALRCAIAEHFGARLTLATINDPLINDIAEMKLGPAWLPEHSERELRGFFKQTFEHRSLGMVDLAFEVVTRCSECADNSAENSAPHRVPQTIHTRTKAVRRLPVVDGDRHVTAAEVIEAFEGIFESDNVVSSLHEA